MKKFILFLLLSWTMQIAFSQEDSIWKPNLHITGYVNTIAEYSDLSNGFESPKSAAIGLSEAAFLVSYKPLSRFEFKGTFVYTHYVRDIQSLLVEAYGTYTLTDQLKLSAGKYLTPMSPVNQYFYAPLNPSASLPMVVSHHFLIPQSLSGFQISGKFGTDLQVGYNATYGTYRSDGHPSYGIIGLQGREDFSVYIYSDPNPTAPEYHLGGTGRIFFNYNDIINLGFNYFDGREATQPIQTLTAAGVVSSNLKATRYAMGSDLQFKYNGIKLNAEYWYGGQRTTQLANQIQNNYSGYYAELIYDIGLFSPYARYDFSDDAKGSLYAAKMASKMIDVEFPCTNISAGIAFRPFYEILLKMEYHYIDTKTNYSNVNIPSALQTLLPPDNPLKVTASNYNYYILSLVYSF